MTELIDMNITIIRGWRVGVVERETDDGFLYEIVHRGNYFTGEVLAQINLVKGEGFIVSTQASNPDAKDTRYKWENPVTLHTVEEALEETHRFARARLSELVAEKQKSEDDAHRLQTQRSQFLAALEQRKVQEREPDEK